MLEAANLATKQAAFPAALTLGRKRLIPVPPMARFAFRGDEAAQERAGSALGLSFPPTLRAEQAGEIAVLWQGPDEFLILAPAAEKLALFARIETALADHPHALVDVSERNVGLILEGDSVAPLLATAIMLDLSPGQFPVAMTTRTLFGKADITLWRQGADRFQIEVWRSFAPYVVGLLEEGARGV